MRKDTGHPFGFYRCLVHDDGHVAVLSGGKEMNHRVEAMAVLLAEFGLQDWRLDWLALEDATLRHVSGLGCERCRIRLSCGCDINADVLAGRCPHGTAKAIEAAAKRCGYAEATGGPLAWPI